MAKTRRRASGKRRFPRWLPYALGAAALLGTALALLIGKPPGMPAWDASEPMRAGDLVAGRYRAGAEAAAVREAPAAKSERDGEQHWELENATLRFAGTPLRLTGADIRGEGWAGPRGLRVGDTLDALYRAIPMTAHDAAYEADYEEPPGDYVLLYAAGIAPDGLPEEPYAVIVPSGDSLRAHFAARTEEGAFALCDVYADPDTDLIRRIRWEIAPSDGLWEKLL